MASLAEEMPMAPTEMGGLALDACIALLLGFLPKETSDVARTAMLSALGKLIARGEDARVLGGRKLSGTSCWDVVSR